MTSHPFHYDARRQELSDGRAVLALILLALAWVMFC
jgi:hypothetical protein